MLDVLVLWRDKLQFYNGERGRAHIKDIHTGEERDVSFSQLNKAINEWLVTAIDRDGNIIKDVSKISKNKQTVTNDKELPYENRKYIYNIAAKIRKIRKIRSDIKTWNSNYNFMNDRFYILYAEYKTSCVKSSLTSLRSYNSKFDSLIKYYKKLLNTTIKEAAEERKAAEEAMLQAEKDREQKEAALLREKERNELLRQHQELIDKINSVVESPCKIFKSANACNEGAYKCRLGLYAKAYKNKKYATDNMEVKELINNLVRCINLYNSYCSKLMYKLDDRSRSVFKIQLLEPIELSLTQCINYLPLLCEKGYKIDINERILNEYKTNALEQYNNEWGIE